MITDLSAQSRASLQYSMPQSRASLTDVRQFRCCDPVLITDISAQSRAAVHDNGPQRTIRT
jgi:hypothetical protein